MIRYFQAAALAALLVVGSADAASRAAVDTSGPNQLIESAANIMISELDARRAEFRKDRRKLASVVDEVLLPHFDVSHAARLVLGRHWRTASAAQRQRFIDAFYGSLMANYGDALVEFTGDRIRLIPTPVAAEATTAVVRTEVRRSNGQKIPVNYAMRKTEAGWKAWDVIIEGISYVKSFREDFAAEIDQKGLEAVIQRLEAQNQSAGVGAARS